MKRRVFKRVGPDRYVVRTAREKRTTRAKYTDFEGMSLKELQKYARSKGISVKRTKQDGSEGKTNLLKPELIERIRSEYVHKSLDR